MITANKDKQTRMNHKKKIILVSALLMPVHCKTRSWSDFQGFCQLLQQAVGGQS
ncbi:MAG: hypothetical protein V7735_23370 [Photobacterium frigidiphilum]